MEICQRTCERLQDLIRDNDRVLIPPCSSTLQLERSLENTFGSCFNVLEYDFGAGDLSLETFNNASGSHGMRFLLPVKYALSTKQISVARWLP